MGEIVARRRRRLLAGVVLGRFDKDDVQLPSGALGAARAGNARGTASLCCAKRTVLLRAPPRAREIDDVAMLFTCVWFQPALCNLILFLRIRRNVG